MSDEQTSKSIRCLICKYMSYNMENMGPYRGVIYNHLGKPIELNMCRGHEQELFLLGQYRFLDKYEKRRTDLMEVDKDYGLVVTLMNLLKEYKEKQKNLEFKRSGAA